MSTRMCRRAVIYGLSMFVAGVLLLLAATASVDPSPRPLAGYLLIGMQACVSYFFACVEDWQIKNYPHLEKYRDAPKAPQRREPR